MKLTVSIPSLGDDEYLFFVEVSAVNKVKKNGIFYYTATCGPQSGVI